MKVNKLSAKMYHLTLIVALGIASLFVGFRVEPDAATVATVPVEGIELYPAAIETVRLLNEHRAQNGAGPLTLDSELTDLAMTRAFELFIEFNHTRPNGTKLGNENIGRNIWNLKDGDKPEDIARAGINLFKSSPSHNSIMTNPNARSIGVGLVSSGRGGPVRICYLLYGISTGPQVPDSAVNKKTVRNIEVDREHAVLDVSTTGIMEYGGTGTVEVSYGTIPSSALTFSSSNPSIVNINPTTGAYSVVGTGSVTITAKLKNNASVAGAWQGTVSGANINSEYFSVSMDGVATEVPYNSVWLIKGASDFQYQYKGLEIKPKITVKDRRTGNALAEGRDYTVSYSHTRNTGTSSIDATITITGKGNYTRSATRRFQILPQEQSSGNADSSSNNSNNGGYVNSGNSSAGNSTSSGSTASGGTTKPSQTVKPGNTTNGSVKVSLKAPTVSAANSSKGITVRWKDASKVQGYRIYRRSGKGKWKKLATVGANVRSYVDRKVKNGTLYYYTVRGYYGSRQSSYNKTGKAAYRLTNIRLSSLKNNKARSVVVKWKKNAKATGYQVQYSTNKNLRGAKTKTIKGSSKTSYTLTRMLKGKTYYVRVRAYYSRKGVKSYTAWSAAKAVRIRK